MEAKVIYLLVVIISSMWLDFPGICCANTNKNILQGQTVSFECSLTEAWPPGDIYWLFEWKTRNGYGLKRNAKESRRLEGEQFSERGDYEITFESSGSAIIHHLCKLTITNTGVNDEGDFSCIHDGWARNRGKFYTGSLSVTHPSEGSPECSALPIGNDGAKVTVGSVIRFQCRLEGDDAKTKLAWYQNDENAFGDYIVVNYTLKDVDNGADFVCKTAESTSEQPECRVTPFEQLPNVTITPFTLVVSCGNQGSFMCCSEGVPYIRRTDWYVNGSLVADGTQFRITNNEGCNELHIFNVTREDNGTKVTCEVSIPTGLSASAIATINVLKDAHEVSTISSSTVQDSSNTLRISTKGIASSSQSVYASGLTSSSTLKYDTTSKKSTTSVNNIPQQTEILRRNNSSQISNQIIPIGIVIGLVTVITIIVLIIVLYHRRKYRQSNGIAGNPNDRKSEENDYQVDIQMELPNQQHAIAFSTPDNLYQDTHVVHNQVEVGNSRPKNKDKNVEGLTYASLDLNEPVNDNEILNPSANEAVMYADVRHA